MTRTIAALLCFLMTLAGGAARADSLPPPGTLHLPMTLVAETRGVAAGGTVTLAIDSRPAAGWHGYWGENPGDAGFPPKAQWTLPAGAKVGAWRWPVPGTLKIAGLMNFVYERPFAPLIDLTVPAGLAAGTTLPVRLQLDYLVCTDAICVPEQQELAVDLTVGAAGVRDARFDGWRRAVPKPIGAAATYALGKDGVRLAIAYPASAPLADAFFFPATSGALDHAAPQMVTRDGDRLLIATTGKPTGAIDGVLRIGPGRGLSVHAIAGEVPGARGWLGAALLAFAGALLGGLILNIMPCVFPILSLKALSLARHGEGEAAARRDALAYAAGVVLVCVGLGAAILGLRAGGQAVGWAFQLQSPRVLVVLLLLSVALALNFAGLFEMMTPAFAGRSGGGGAFATGALAAFVATPCTGPFMGAALGAALVLPWGAALAVFAGLGLGLALPFLLLGFVPALRRRLPKPGGWMETFRHVLSVPMWLTAIALAWVLGRVAGIDGLTTALVAALAIGLLLWVGGLRQRRGAAFGWPLAVGLVLVAALGGGLVANARPAGATTVAAGETAFSEATLASLRAADKPVFAYFTADWCLTCKVNERLAIEPARAAMAGKGVAVLVGDWTNGDAALGRFIEAHDRAGVPLYLYYAPGAAEPRVLPQVLTPGMLVALPSS